jgi:hypothetical protein
VGFQYNAKHERKLSRGQVLVLASFSIAMLLGMVGLSTDVGMLWRVRREAQTAADAAAVAGSRALGQGLNATAAATQMTGLNGFTNGANGVTVAVNNPPLGGAYAGNSNYVETVVTQAANTYFLRALGYTTVNVSARAVAGGISSPNCLYTIDPSGSGALDMTGSGSISSSCGIAVDSSSSNALTATGSMSITATSVGVVGNYSLTGSGSITPTPITGIASSADPLSYVQAPTVGACTYTGTSYTGSGSKTLTPGVYCGGISFTGSYTATFSPGTYVLLGGGLDVTGSATLSGTGVTFYLTKNSSYPYHPISLTGSTRTNFSAPTSGPLAGILFFQDRSVPVGSSASTVTGSSASSWDGALYFPTTKLSYTGSSSGSGYTILVAYDLSMTGSGTMTLGSNYSSLPNGSPIKSNALYE